MVTRQWRAIPVVPGDTGYRFPETYRFVDDLAERLRLDLKVYRAAMSPAWRESRYGKLWKQGYPSIGDWHTSHKLTDGMTEEETRFFGLKRECRLHESSTPNG